ncbi:hypothetical protein ACP70R_024686 [Stipagrostis hirtigluma subsp. patula]
MAAAVLNAFASKLVGILMGMAKEEVEMLLGVPGEITKLEARLKDVSCMLADAESTRIRSSAVERWVRELKDAMYDVDDILDLCKIMEGGEDPTAGTASTPKAAPRCWSIPTPSCFRNQVAAHQIGRKIKALNQRILDIKERGSLFEFIRQEIRSSDHSTSRAAKSVSDVDRMSTPNNIRSDDVVGEKIKKDKKKIVDLLFKVHDDPLVSKNNVIVSCALIGAGGIGKSTLAGLVFDDSKVKENFKSRIWLSINKQVDPIGLLQRVISALGCKYDGYVGDKALLECALREAVRHKKFLLVLDDVWTDSEHAWSNVLRVPLNDGAPGSRVLVTTRSEEVALKMEAQDHHRVEKLEEEDAWVLLKKQVVYNESSEREVDRLKDIGMKIVKRCDGLPLAIKVLGGHLRKINKTRHAWTKVSDHVAWSISSLDKNINQAVHLSYEELPPHLKQCFVCCSLIPKEELIRPGDIVQLWIAEGYVNDEKSSKLPEDLGFEYYQELVWSNLLEPSKGSHGSACTMHDVVRSFAQYIIEDEGILVVSEAEGQDLNITLRTSKLRHLSISNKAVEWDALQKQVSLRTLMLFGSTMVELKDSWNTLSCLRVLYLDNVNLVEQPDSICRLKHLRCLSLSGTSVSTIPQAIGDLKFLQAIDLVGCKNISQLPDSILKLQKLRLLNVRGTKIASVPRGFGKLKDLVILTGFPAHSDDCAEGWCSLEELGSLSKLKILDIIGLEKACSGSMAAKAKLCSKHHLTELNLKFASRLGDNGEVEDISKEEQEQNEEVLSNLCPPTCIEQLVIKGYSGRGLPPWARAMSRFDGLRRFALEGYPYCKQLPIALGELPSLEYFWVERAPCIEKIGHDLLLPSSRTGTGVDRAAFPKLKRLGFEDMLGWTEWEWEQEIKAMTALEGLMISNCKLKHLPPGLAHHAARLTHLDLRNALHLVSVENFLSLVELKLSDNPRLERIRNCPSLQDIIIFNCPGLKLLEDLPPLESIGWKDLEAETLPPYLGEAKVNKLNVYCSLSLLNLISLQDDSSGSEWGKIRHVQQLKAYACTSGEDDLDGCIYYTKEPYSFEAYLFQSTAT